MNENTRNNMSIFVGTPLSPAVGKWINLEITYDGIMDEREFHDYLVAEIASIAGVGRDWIFSDNENMWPGFGELESTEQIAKYVSTIMEADEPELAKGSIDVLLDLGIDKFKECVENWEEWVTFRPDVDERDLAGEVLDMRLDSIRSMVGNYGNKEVAKILNKELEWISMYFDYDSLWRDMDIEGTYVKKDGGIYEVTI